MGSGKFAICCAAVVMWASQMACQETCEGNCRSTNTVHSHIQGLIFQTYENVLHMRNCCRMCEENARCTGFNFCGSGSPNGGGCLPYQAGNGRPALGGTCELVNWEGSPVYYDNAIFRQPNAFPAENYWESGVKRCDLPNPAPGIPMSYTYASGSTTAEVAARIAAAAAAGGK